VAGQLVDGVIVKKAEARRIFEKEVRKGVDPGLVEWTRGNVFNTRVFPIPANGQRTIRLRWVAPLERDAAGTFYALPLGFEDKIAEGHIRIEVVKPNDKPVLEGAKGLDLKFDERFVAETTVKDAALSQKLRVRVPDADRRPVQVETSASGTTWFSITERAAPPADLAAIRIKRLRLVWDASASRRSADRERELGVLRRFFEQQGDLEVYVQIVRDEITPAQSFTLPADAARLLETLRKTPLDGGTQLARLSPGPDDKKVDAVLIATDGFSTYGDSQPTPLGAPTYILSSSRDAGHDALARMAADNGGLYLDLNRVTDDEAVSRIGKPVWSLIQAAVESGTVKALTPSGLEPALGTTLVSGELGSDKAVIRLAWGVPGQAASVVKRYEILKGDTRGEVVRVAWANKRLAELVTRPEENADALVALGKTHGLVTPGTSLLVLETLDQYLEHGVRPPAMLADMRAAWDRRIEERRVEEETSERQRLDNVHGMWREEVAWYERTFTYPPNFRIGGVANKISVAEGRAMGAAAPSASEASPAPPSEPMADREESDDRRDSPKKKDSKGGGDEDPEPGVALTPWDPQTPWTKALKAAKVSEREKTYLDLRDKHGTAPSFYLDCADVFLGFKDQATALRILSNVAELKLDDPALLRVLAHRLSQLERLSTAISIFEHVLTLRPEEPQSHRDLALVLARRARTQKAVHLAREDWRRAIDHLAVVVKGRWDRFQGIEIIALHELNRFWLEAKAQGVTGGFPLEGRFEHAMQLDTRIVMTWDADMTDMDLHVVEPSGEEAYYSHNLTTIGGKVSRDFTQGYGPEIYAVKKAMRGTYKVKTKFFGSSAAQLIGAVTLQVDVFTNWGRENEKRRSMTLRLTESKEEFVVGEIEF
jgi:Ca-activated chloride channel family protein